jgi:hypothetical protein
MRSKNLGFINRECAHYSELDTALEPQPDLIVLGLSCGAREQASKLKAKRGIARVSRSHPLRQPTAEEGARERTDSHSQACLAARSGV